MGNECFCEHEARFCRMRSWCAGSCTGGIHAATAHGLHKSLPTNDASTCNLGTPKMFLPHSPFHGELNRLLLDHSHYDGVMVTGGTLLPRQRRPCIQTLPCCRCWKQKQKSRRSFEERRMQRLKLGRNLP